MLTQTSQPKAGKLGFSLIETVVAIAILLIVVSGIMNLVYQGTISSQQQQERIVATYLAAEAIEFLRADRDTHWLERIGSNSFNEWVNGSEIGTCQSSNGCWIDARPGLENIDQCSSDCVPLNYNSSSSLYGYSSGVDWRESRYVRVVKIDIFDHNNNGNTDEAIVTVTVSWERSGGDTSVVTLKDSLTAWWR